MTAGLFLAILAAPAIAFCAESGGDLPPLVPPKNVMAPEDKRKALMEQHAEAQKVIRKKLQLARVLLKINRGQECLDICNEVLEMDPGNVAALSIHRKANAKLKGVTDSNLEVERHNRDTEALRKVAEESLIPADKAPLPRPILKESSIPFAEADSVEKSTAILQQRLPEINLIGADINYVLQLLFKTTGVNIVYNPSDLSDKTVTIHARNLTLEDVLKYLSRTLKIGYTVDRNTVWIYSADDEDVARSLMRPVVIPLRVGLTAATGGGSGGEGQGGGQEGAGGSATSDVEALLAWMEENWPGWTPETRWRLDHKLNRLVIVSTPDLVKDVRRMIAAIDVPPVQIMISARFVNVSENTLDRLGFNWQLTPNPDSIPSTDNNASFKDNKSRISSLTSDLSVSGDVSDALNLGTVSVLNDHQLNLTMQALTQSTGTKILTAPRVIALNNKPAEIKLVRAYPYPTDWETVTAGTSGTETSSTATTVIPSSWAEQDLGVSLQVFPSVGSDMKTITLQIAPEITDLQELITYNIVTTNASGDQEATQVSRPVFQTNSLQVESVVEDGQTVVIGGLFSDDVSEINKGVPVLGKVPLLGKLFNSKNNSRERSCLLIFVTARLITPANQTYTDEFASDLVPDVGGGVGSSTLVPGVPQDD